MKSYYISLLVGGSSHRLLLIKLFSFLLKNIPTNGQWLNCEVLNAFIKHLTWLSSIKSTSLSNACIFWLVFLQRFSISLPGESFMPDFTPSNFPSLPLFTLAPWILIATSLSSYKKVTFLNIYLYVILFKQRETFVCAIF